MILSLVSNWEPKTLNLLSLVNLSSGNHIDTTMTEHAFSGLGVTKTLSTELKQDDIKLIMDELALPEALYQEIQQGANFLTVLRNWRGHNAFLFHQSLNHIRPDLTAVACKVKWLCVSSPDQVGYKEEEKLSIKSLIQLLKSEISKEDWELIYMEVTGGAGENVNFEMTINKLMEKGYIAKDLCALKSILEQLGRNDLVKQLAEYQNEFHSMEEGEFESKFRKEVGIQEKEMKQWEQKLKLFLQMQYETVQQMLGDTEAVKLEEVYIDLTILKQKPRPVNLEDETTYSEIAYLRQIANKEVQIEPVDFKQELRTYEATKPEIWCLIGNPGCGKTFLAKRTALRFSCEELANIRYSISIPCRNTEWHEMETTRQENKLEIESEYISKWLCLGLPKGPNWSKDLSKHLTQSDGDGLLLIIDGLDEFTRKVSFEKTLLCILLTRQSLTKSTIILTSRPGAWTDISSSHELKIDRHYQVLGFSPDNRDLYFKKQITDVRKLKACRELMERHDEMKQLSLIPVNASLFAALLKGEDAASINTLTRLYSELTLYLVRRELSRMGLHAFSRVALLSDLHPDVQVCLERIGFIAFLGVANRDLMSDETVPLIVGKDEYPSNCLGLAHEHYKQEAVGLIKKVWTFAHLTMQEFAAAHWLSNNTWTKQCASIRYISHSRANFSLFRMLVRFLCGILSDRSAAVLSIMYRYLTPQPTQLIDMPLTFQIFLATALSPNWELFNKCYFQMSAIFYETNSNHITKQFAYYRQFLPDPIYFYFNQTVSPNEWICFLQSLQLLSQIQLISIDIKFINAKQFIDLFEKLNVCYVQYLALSFSGKKGTNLPSEILAYTDTIRDTQLMVDTKLCLYLQDCDLTNDTAVNIFSPNTNQILSSLILRCNSYSNECQQQIANQLTALEYIYIHIKYGYLGDLENESKAVIDPKFIFPALLKATQTKALHLPDIPSDYSPLLTELSNFSNLQEIALPDYSLLPAICHLSNLTYLRIELSCQASGDFPLLLQLIFENRNSLKYLCLSSLMYILTDMGIFLSCIALCTNLVELWLRDTDLTTEDISLWSHTVSNMKALVVLDLWLVRLCDTGFQSLCAGLAYHPTIMELSVVSANLTSLSCVPLILLIPTVTQLERLTVSCLKEPDEAAHKLLQETADEYSIQLTLY